MSITGQLNVAVVHRSLAQDALADVHNTRLDSTESKLMIRGTEDLGAGVVANFFVAAGIATDTGNGSWCRGDCWLGLRGPLGSIRLGNALPIYDDVSLPWYFVEAAGNHNPAMLWANCGNRAGLSEGCVDSYLARTLRYDTPRWAGWSGSASVSDPSDDLAGDPRRAKVYALGAEYRAGALYLGFAQEQLRDVRAVGLVDSATTVSLWLHGWLTLGAGIEHLRYSVATGGALERNYAGLMLQHTTGPHTVWANLGVAGSGYGSAANGSVVNAIAHADDSGASMTTLGYRYRLSKTTQVYAYWNEIANGRNGRYSFDGSPPQQAGWRLSALALGMTKRF